MRILYDGEVYRTQAAGGVNRYFAQLIRRLPSSWTPILSLTQQPQIHHPQHAALQFEFAPPASKLAFLTKWRQRRHFRQLYEQIDADVVHPTYYRLLSAQPPATLRAPRVITVYDMIHERLGGLVRRQGHNTRMKREAIESAAAVICISENTRRDLLEFYPQVEDRVSVIHLAADWELPAAGTRGPQGKDAQPSRPKIESETRPCASSPAKISPAESLASTPYFVYVGSRAAYKNFDRLLTAFRAAVDRYPACRLAVVGGRFSRTEMKQIDELRLGKHIVPCGVLPDVELQELYRHSLALVYPSMYEGFGIPLLEAMLCETVVVAADRSSIPEVVDNAAILFDPQSTSGLADVLLDLLAHPERRDVWITRGRSRAAMFSWQRTVAATMDVYRSVAATGSARGLDYIVPGFSWRARRQPAA